MKKNVKKQEFNKEWTFDCCSINEHNKVYCF